MGMTSSVDGGLDQPQNGLRQQPRPRVLHVLDHSWPILSGYSVRSRNLLTAQHRTGISVRALTGPLHELDDRTSSNSVLDGVEYLRTPIRGPLASVALGKRWHFIREGEVV